MAWKRFQFKDQTVFVRVLSSGKPIVHRGRVEMRYRLGATKSYRATPDGLLEIEGDTEILSDDAFSGTPAPTAATVQAVREEPTRAPTDETIIIHTDGACSGNPGPAGIGVLIERGDEAIEHSEYIGEGTNNVAELTAILRALEMLRPEDKDAHVLLYTDSGWSLGVLIGGWKAKANLELIGQIKERLPNHPNLELLKVRGHAGQSGNEEADELATMAVRREASRTRTRKRSKSPPPAP